jgi:hypothetical protein
MPNIRDSTQKLDAFYNSAIVDFIDGNKKKVNPAVLK